jgi:two-component system, chemotaxis family, CheB/CheR fusion protein
LTEANGPRLLSGVAGRLLDDYPDAAKSLAILLKLDGYEAEVAYRGASALEAARARPPQAVLLDISMPSMDGFRVAQRLRALPGLADVVLIAITGYEGPGWRPGLRGRVTPCG